MRPTIIVTRHPALVQYVIELGLATENTVVLEHITDPEEVRFRHVIGVLPLRLARHAASVVEIPLDLPPTLRGVELSIEQVRQYAGEPAEYVVRMQEHSGLLAGALSRREANALWPGATDPWVAIEASLAAWASKHGLVEHSARGVQAAGELTPEKTEILTRISKIPAPPGGMVRGVSLWNGYPTLAVDARCGGHSTTRFYAPVEKP